ncbi:MAG: hypothetical protein KTR33_08950 [Gammaproteobacteria bacterium]|nr:hypothetical protein [Gammaproteobacteria bacterium]
MTNTDKSLTTVIAALILLVGGCAEDAVNQTTADDDTVIETVVTPQLPGSWSTGCLVKPNSLSVRLTYLREVISFTSDTISFEYGEFTDPGCSVVAISNPGTTRTGAWALGGEVVTTDGLTALEFDYAVAEAGASAVLNQNILYFQENRIFLGIPTQSGARPDTLALEVPYTRQ